MAIEETFSPLDPLGPEFGGINRPVLDEKGFQPFEGDLIKPEPINFPKVYIPTAPSPGLDIPTLNVKRDVVGKFPNKPHTSKKPTSGKDVEIATKNYLDAFFQSNQDKNNYAKIYSYNPGPDGNAFYKRYAAYGQKTFDEIDFHPLRNNEANFNARTTALDDMGRMLNHSFLPLVGLGFTSSLKSLGKMVQGDFTSADLDEAREYEEYAAIGQSSKGGFSGFFNNTLMNFGYTAGIIGEAIIEEGVAALLAPVTAGGSTFVATANIASKIGKAFKGFDLMKDGYSAVRGTLKSLNNLPNARKFYDTIKAGSKTTLGKALNPLENTFGAIGDIGKLDNISSLAKISKTAGGFYRDVRNLNMAVAEARLEAGMTENKVFDNLYNNYYAKTGEGPSDDLQYQFKQQAKDASIDTFYKNAGLIYVSNAITFDNITGPKGGLRNFIKNTREDILTLGAKEGEKSFGKFGKIIYDNAAKKFVLEKNNIKELAKSWYKNPGAKTLAKTAGYFKANFTEGFQEVSQEVIAGANEKYYTDSFKSNLLQSNLFSQAVMSSTIKKQKGDYYADEFGNQMTGQGFETFSSGFFMGMFAGPLNNAIPFLSSQYNRMYNQDEYVKWKDMKENTANDIISELNDISLPEMLSDKNHNLGVQDLVSKVKRSGTKKEALDAETESFVESAGIMLKYGTTDVFTQKLKDLQTATDEEFMDAIPGIEQQDIEKYKSRIDTSITRLERIQDRYKKYQDKFPNPVNETQLDAKAPDYNEKIILSRAWNRATTNAVFFNESFEDVMGRINDIQKTYVSSKSLGKANYADTMAIFKTDGMGNHLNTLESELASVKQALTKDPKRIAALTSKIDSLKTFQTSYDKFNRFFKREDYANEVAQELETKNGKEATAEEVAEALNQKYGNLEDISLSEPILQDLKTAHHNYLKSLAGEKDDFAFDEDLDKGFELLTDYYKLDQEKKQLAKYVDLLHNPQNFIDIVRKNGEWMTKMYENRSEYYHDLVYKQLGMIENNALLNALADKGFFISTEDFENYIKAGIPPKEIFNAAESRVYKEGTEEYNEVYRYYFVKRAELEEINGKSKTEIVDQAYRDKLDELDASEKEAIDKLPKTRVEEMQGEIIPKGKNKSFGISEIIIEAEPGDYIRADYEDGEEPLMLYMDDKKQLRADGPEGDVLDPKTIKTKFTKAVRYTVEMQADPKEVEKIKKQFNAARAEVKKQYQNDKKLIIDTKQDYTFSFEGKDINTKDLSIEDIKLFQARIADRIKVLTEEQPTLETEELKAKNKKMLEDLNVTMTNLSKILDAKATQDYSPEQKKAIRLIQNLIEKQKNVEEGYMLTEDDEVTGLKKGNIAYRVNGQIHRRTTSAIQDVVEEGYQYNGESVINDAFSKTIGLSGLNPASITLFIEEIRPTSSRIGFDSQLLIELETFLKNIEGKSKSQIDIESDALKINKQINKINEKIEVAEKDNNPIRVDNLKKQREDLYSKLAELNSKIKGLQNSLDQTDNQQNINQSTKQEKISVNGIEEIIFSNPNFKLEGFNLDNNYWNVITSTDRAKVLVNINGIIVPFYLTTGQAKKDLVPGWYPFFGIGKDGWLNKTDKSDMETYYERYWGKEAADIVQSISKELNNFYGNDPLVFTNDGDPTATSRPLSTLADKTEDYINSKLSYTPAINNTDARTILRSNVEKLGKEINAKYNKDLASLEKENTLAKLNALNAGLTGISDASKRFKISQLRADEQADLLVAIPNIVDFPDTYGDKQGDMPDNLYAIYKPIYNRYDKLISNISSTSGQLELMTNDTTLEMIMAFAKEKSYEDGRTAGNFVDDAKDYFEKGIKPEFDEKIITREAYDSLFGPEGYLTELKRKVDNRELYIVGRGLVVYDSDITRPEGSKLPGKDRIAGEIDLIVADRKGNLSIVDLKTGEPRKWNNFNKVNRTSSDNFHSKRENYTLQQAAYARMLENMIGVKASVSLLPIERLSNKDTRQITRAGRPNSPSIYKKLEYKKDVDGNFMRTERGELDYTVKEGETASDMLIPLYPETVADKMNELIPLRKPTQSTKKRVKPVVLKSGEFEMEIEDWDDTGEVDLGLDVKLKPKPANTPPTPPVKLTQEEQLNELLKQIATSNDPEQYIDIIDNLDLEFAGRYSVPLFQAINTRRKELDGEVEPVVSENIIEKDDIFIAKSNIFTSETQKKPYIKEGSKVRVVSYNPETGIVTLVKDEGKRPKPFEVSLDQLNNDFMLENALASTNEPPVIKPKLTKEEEEILNGQADLVSGFLKDPTQTSKAKEDADSKSEQEIEQELLDNLNCE